MRGKGICFSKNGSNCHGLKIAIWESRHSFRMQCYLLKIYYINRIMKRLLIMSLAWLAFSCQSKTGPGSSANYTVKGDTIFLTGNSNLKEKIKTSVVSATPYRHKRSASGIVKAIPNNYAQNCLPFCRADHQILCQAWATGVGECPYF